MRDNLSANDAREWICLKYNQWLLKTENAQQNEEFYWSHIFLDWPVGSLLQFRAFTQNIRGFWIISLGTDTQIDGSKRTEGLWMVYIAVGVYSTVLHRWIQTGMFHGGKHVVCLTFSHQSDTWNTLAFSLHISAVNMFGRYKWLWCLQYFLIVDFLMATFCTKNKNFWRRSRCLVVWHKSPFNLSCLIPWQSEAFFVSRSALQVDVRTW